MALQSIKSGAFKFSKTDENLDKVSTAGTIIISVDDDTNLTGDIRVHDGVTPGGISAPPPGTISYIITPRKMITEEWIANTHSSFITANTITLETNYPTNGDLLDGPYKFFRIRIEHQRSDVGLTGDYLSTTRNLGYNSFDLPNLYRFTGYEYPFVAEISASSIGNTNRKNERYETHDGTDHLYYSFDCDANTLTLSTNNYVYPIETGDKVILQYVDGLTGFQDPDGWFYCDGRNINKTKYPSLYKEIGDIWNISPSNEHLLDGGFDYTDGSADKLTYPYQDIREYYSKGFEKRFDVNYSRGRVRVFKNYDGTVDYPKLFEVPDTDYSLGQNADGQTYVRFPDSNIPLNGERLVFVGTPESDLFQIPDFRGYYLRAWNSNSYLDTSNIIKNYTPAGIQSKKHFAVQKHSHYISMDLSGEHSHEYTPWEFGDNEPYARAVWGGWPVSTRHNGDHDLHLEGLENESFYGKWKWDDTSNETDPDKRLTKIRHGGIGDNMHPEPRMWSSMMHHNRSSHIMGLDAYAFYSKDHTTYVLGSGPSNMADFGPTRTENTVYNWKHKHFMHFKKTFIDPGGDRGRTTAALGYETNPAGMTAKYGESESSSNHSPAGNNDGDSKKGYGGNRVVGRPTQSIDEVDITNVRIPTFIKY